MASDTPTQADIERLAEKFIETNSGSWGMPQQATFSALMQTVGILLRELQALRARDGYVRVPGAATWEQLCAGVATLDGYVGQTMTSYVRVRLIWEAMVAAYKEGQTPIVLAAAEKGKV